MANYGLANTLYICGGLFFIGFLFTLFMAPETKNMSLTEASSIKKGATLETESPVIRKAVN
jgi:putative MFS transporter